MCPRQSPTTHTEQLGAEVAVYDRARQQVHALNVTAGRVWQLCDGTKSPDAMAAALAQDGVPEAEAVVDLTLRELARLHLLELPVASRADRPSRTRRWLLGRGVAAAMLPAIYSIVAPSSVDAQSLPPPPGAPTLTSLSPNQGAPGTTVVVAVTGTGFGTTVAVSGTGVTPGNLEEISSTSLRVTFTIAANAAPGPRNVTVTTADGTSNVLPFTVNAPAPPEAPTLTRVSPNNGIRGETVPVTLTGTNFIVGATTVNVGGGGVTVNNVIVGSSTSLTASFVLDLTTAGPRVVTVATKAGRSGGRTFTINAEPGSETFTSVGTETFTVPGGVVRVTIEATGAAGANGASNPPLFDGGAGGLGGRTTATVAVTPGASLTVRVGGAALIDVGGFNGGGRSTGEGGGGGGASDVHAGATPLVIAGGGGGGGSYSAGAGNTTGGAGGDGGGLSGEPGEAVVLGGGGGGEGTEVAGGAGGTRGSLSGADGTDGVAGRGGTGGAFSGVLGGGGGGGGLFGGGGGGCGNGESGAGGGGGGSSFAAPGAKGVVHQKGVNSGDGSVTISW